MFVREKVVEVIFSIEINTEYISELKTVFVARKNALKFAKITADGFSFQ